MSCFNIHQGSDKQKNFLNDYGTKLKMINELKTEKKNYQLKTGTLKTDENK